ncbi:NAD(P)/FAD-dependent oxidoreductase [Rhodospirillum rubrum]|uniref:FAD dependent oxidoreductase n=1 Tax=Rhodospirillum rubrum (strain ATCC 11170 / ATH 1.1.1 / DSM 467 / LMG 4362 / NCIMB 8255 / S1) TaxID=269796 RepID=Q2RSM5_RHORT|nr:FAD-dependent oxidoreductase [Rhodospirillum rubrum]ABC22870.1 FAD dependent oxidoreductase [Rhodospirillum rubrum ATCC 11170]AEO48593.1 FAD dependent oxidoreductase [Rhodospirillum rubrum F11]MBK5954477.1 FAD-binding oxidoreductase [Rhodospirillum rubrum]QXG78859.1 FAD-binding oxidoreductase [Rhodospirillum rubrum]HAP99394.1 FAD-binding oxidoreductase [Rhodospirillum rubrum]
MAPSTADVVIIGGGVIGAAISYFLAADPLFQGKIVVVERDPSFKDGSTARSAASIRQQFSTPENVRISLFGIDFLRTIHQTLAVEGEPAPDVSLRENGYLLLAASEKGAAILAENQAMQAAEGADIVLQSPSELAARFPWLRTDDLALGAFGLSGEGWLDAFSLLQAFRRKARSLGVVHVTDEVTGIERSGGRVGAVTLASGGRIACGLAVNAAGPRAAMVADMAGLALAVRPRKRFIFVFTCPEALPACPLVVDPSGLYFRPEGDRFICGISPKDGEDDPDCLDLEVDHALFEETLWPLLGGRVEAFERVRFAGAWAGHYAMSLLDGNAVLGPHPDCPNLILANGFSGHGLQQAPAVGRGIAELITHGAYRSLDLSRFAFDRAPIIEKNII